MKEFLISFVVDYTDNTFAVKKASDDGGAMMEIWIEGDLGDQPNPQLPPKCRGWRVVWIKCPEGYIETFSIRR